MLKIMENEMEIFRAWLKKTVKDDKTIKGKDLAKKLGIPATRISYYHSGRVDNGVRTFPKIPFKIRLDILKIAGVKPKEMLEIGRKQLDPTPPANEEITKLQSEMNELKALLPTLKMEATAENTPPNVVKFQSKIEREHFELIRSFKNPRKALEANSLLVKLENLSTEEYYAIVSRIECKVEELEGKINKGSDQKNKTG